MDRRTRVHCRSCGTAYERPEEAATCDVTDQEILEAVRRQLAQTTDGLAHHLHRDSEWVEGAVSRLVRAGPLSVTDDGSLHLDHG